MSGIATMIGKRYKRLMIISYSKNDKHNNRVWKYRCDCGNTGYITTASWNTKRTKSCGCWMSDVLRERNKSLSKQNIVDLTGKVSGRLTAIKLLKTRIHRSAAWLCKCECGNNKVVSSHDFIRKTTRSCGCLDKEIRNSRITDLTGKRFGRLVVVKYANNQIRNSDQSSRWVCKCDCGNESVVSNASLRKGKIQSCGCLKEDASRMAAQQSESISKKRMASQIMWMERQKARDIR